MSNNQPKALLFEKGEFTGAGGKLLKWKVDCDALSDDEIAQIAAIAAPRIPQFKSVFGVPPRVPMISAPNQIDNGRRIANAFVPYISTTVDKILIVDDIWTTGESLKKCATARRLNPDKLLFFVIFSRIPIITKDHWPPVWAMWQFGLMR